MKKRLLLILVIGISISPAIFADTPGPTGERTDPSTLIREGVEGPGSYCQYQGKLSLDKTGGQDNSASGASVAGSALSP